MLNPSRTSLFVIRATIILVQRAPLIWPALLVVLWAGAPAWAPPIIRLLAFLTVLELAFATLVYLPHVARLHCPAAHPASLTSEERRRLFARCTGRGAVGDPEAYIRGWFLGRSDVGKEDVRQFLAWAFFELELEAIKNDGELDLELDQLVAGVEEMLGRSLPAGRTGATSLRLTIDAIETRYRSVVWYAVVALVDHVAHLCLSWHGFEYYAQPRSDFLSVFPPRIQQLTAARRSPVPELGYWYRPHRAPGKLPVVFLHGIGIGLLTYIKFLTQIASAGQAGRHDIGILAVEILPISFRLCRPPLTRAEFLVAMRRILDAHALSDFVLASHSYGSVLSTHLLAQIPQQIRSVVLIDPVSVLLHRPEVAFNFTRRQPRGANEWQLWFFASMDPGVASTLARCFFWRENVLWREDLEEFLGGGAGEEKQKQKQKEKKVKVFLAGRDLIVDTPSVERYLTETGVAEAAAEAAAAVPAPELQVVMFPDLDHAQVFDRAKDRGRIVEAVRECCRM